MSEKSSTPRVKKMVSRRTAKLVTRDGRDYAINVPRRDHGKRYTYVAWGCRCRPCTDANTAYFAQLRAARAAA